MTHNAENDAARVEAWAEDDALMLVMGKHEYDVQGPISDRLAATITEHARGSTRHLAAALRSRVIPPEETQP